MRVDYGGGYSSGGGYGDGYGDGAYGYGDGDGYGYGDGYGSGYGDGGGYGDGDGDGDMAATRAYIAATAAAGVLLAKHSMSLGNVELRREAIALLGARRLFSEMSAEVVSEDIDSHGHPRRLLRVPVPDTRRGYLHALHLIHPTTGEDYFHFVPSGLRTPLEALAWQFNITVDQYRDAIVS